jgi:AbrB family looped-hinge helix DNA binding protein
VTSNDGVEMLYIPKIFREKLGLRKGTYVKVYEDAGKLVIEPLKL